MTAIVQKAGKKFLVPKGWSLVTIGDLFKVTRGKVLPMGLVSPESTGTDPYPVYSSQTKKKGLAGFYSEYLYEDAITWTTDGANAGDVNFRPGKFYCTNVCGVLLNTHGHANACVASILNSVTRGYVSYVGNPKLMNDVMATINIPIPPLAEQRKIAEILRTWDEAIETAEAELKAKQERKRWLTVSLIFSKGTGNKSKSHKYVPIGDFLREDVDSVDPSQSPDEHFELWSIPAHDNGVADYVKGFQVGSHKKLVNPGDVLISKIVPHIQRSRVVGRSERKCRVIASTEWIVFGGGKIEAEYLREVLISEDFHRKFMETITGVGGSLARANVKAVAKIKIPFPSIEEQRKIADVLLCAGADASAIARRIESLLNQKRGLMQKLLTGEVRVAA